LFIYEDIMISGIKSLISISKIKKINLIIKNWILKGIRLLDIGSNPHSKGDDFSRLECDFLEIVKLINIRNDEIIKNVRVMITREIIIYIK